MTNTTNTTYQPQILADQFPYLGVCPFCRTRQMVHSESGLCRNCLPAARAGWNPMQDAAKEQPEKLEQPQPRKRARRCAACRYTVAGWALCAHHWREQNPR